MILNSLRGRVAGIFSITLPGLVLLLMSGCAHKQVSQKPQKPNVLLLCVDDLRPDLNCYGASYISSPNIDQLANQGVLFRHHYANAPSCGPSRYTLLTGQYGPAKNDALFERAAQWRSNPQEVDVSMPEWFRKNGYITVSVGKVSHHPGGRGGDFWNDSTLDEVPNAWDKHLMPCGEWQSPLGAMHGLAHGQVRGDSHEMDVFQSASGPDTIYPDGLIAREGIRQLNDLAADKTKPFFLAIGLIKPHLPFGAPKQYLEKYEGVTLPPIQSPQKPKGITTWHRSGEFMRYNRWNKDPREDSAFAEEVRLHYAACVSYSDYHVGQILAALKKSGADKNTIIILWGDHGWHLGEHAIWGKHSLFEEALHSPLIVYYPGMKNRGVQSDAVVETLDLFPTLCELTGVACPQFAQGQSLKGILEQPVSEGHPAYAYWNGSRTIRTATHRLILHKNGFVELYDHRSPQKEDLNIAEDNPQIVEKLKSMLVRRLGE